AAVSRWLPLRDAALATALLLAAVYAGSSGLAHFDAAVIGYPAANAAASFETVQRMSAFWRRPPSAFYARALLEAVRRPRELRRLLGAAGRDLAAQRFIARRSRVRWLAHLLLSVGTLVSFAITLPLVWGWLRFEADGGRSYRAILVAVPVVRFAPEGVVGWLVFHGLSLAAVAVALGATYFLLVRLRAPPGGDRTGRAPRRAVPAAARGVGGPPGGGVGMARLPAPAEALADAFGPHLSYEPPGGFAARAAPDRKVNTHCCFCGQQCGVTLLVKDERVVGIEPWEEFPFNQG